MTAIDGPLALGAGDAVQSRPGGVFARPSSSTTGWRSWVTTVDHKKIAIMYGVSSIFFFIIGGIEALLIRLQLATPACPLLITGSIYAAGEARAHLIAEYGAKPLRF